MQPALLVFELVCTLFLAVSATLAILFSLHWPLVGDASLIHYIVFLTRHGMAPYRVLGDMNMPGSFLLEMSAMKLYGPGPLAWRLYDLTLLLLASLAFAILTRPHLRRGKASSTDTRQIAAWFPAIFSGAIFTLIHLRDGLAQGGQRDLAMAVLLLLATASLSLAIRTTTHTGCPALAKPRWGGAPLSLFTLFGLFAGLALTIKPTALPLALAQLVVARIALNRPRTQLTLAAIAGALIGPAIALTWLLHEQALQPFQAGIHGIVPYYQSLGHKPVPYLLQHCLSPLMAPVLIWLAVLALTRPKLAVRANPTRAMLLAGVLFGLISYLAQPRGFPYYRYPLLAFLIPLLALDLTQSLTSADHTITTRPTLRTRAAVALAALALAISALFLAPQSAILVHRFRWQQTDFISTLEASLNRLGGSALSGHIQCIDSISGCGTTLYKMRLVQQTGILSDFLLFGPPKTPVISQARQSFASQIFTNPPQVIVISSWLHIDGPDNYRKLDRWPELQHFLATNYRLDTDWHPTRPMRWWSREELGNSYRIYVRTTPPPNPHTAAP